MRWKVQIYKEPCIGDTKIINKFLFFPKCINGQCRWLENVRFMKKYINDSNNYMNWVGSKWLNH